VIYVERSEPGQWCETCQADEGEHRPAVLDWWDSGWEGGPLDREALCLVCFVCDVLSLGKPWRQWGRGLEVVE
jgi:hypothetical protein